MDKLTRLGQLCRLVEEAGGQVDGRKKLHKLAYLCQRAGTDLGQSFVFHMYGVYSPSLAQDLQAARAWKLLAESEPNNSGYEISLGATRLDSNTAIPGNGRGFSIVRQLAAESPAVLEILSTIVYLVDNGYCGERLHQKLQELKGHLSSVFPTAFRLAQEHFPFPL